MLTYLCDGHWLIANANTKLRSTEQRKNKSLGWRMTSALLSQITHDEKSKCSNATFSTLGPWWKEARRGDWSLGVATAACWCHAPRRAPLLRGRDMPGQVENNQIFAKRTKRPRPDGFTAELSWRPTGHRLNINHSPPKRLQLVAGLGWPVKSS